MRKLLFAVLLISLSSILLAGIEDLVEGAIEKGFDVIKDDLVERIDNDTVKDVLNTALDAGESSAASYLLGSKKKDPNWILSAPSQNEESLLAENIDRFFRKFNAGSQVSTPLEIHFLGGKRTPEPFLAPDSSTTRVPSFSLDDRPVDYALGGLPTAQKLAAPLKAAASGPSYQYLVALETSSPLLASAVKQIQTWANQFNAMSIQSYDLAAALVPGMGPKIQRGDAYACEQELIAEGHDLLTAKTLCQDKKTRDFALRKLANRNEQVLAGSYNVADKVLSQMGIEHDKELLLNLTGTVVSDSSGRIDQHPPLYRQLIGLISDGKPFENGYRISGSGLKIRRGKVELEGTSQKEKILSLFKSIQKKLREDGALTEEEKALLGSSHFPAAGFIALATQYKGSGSGLILERYSELIAFERTVQFLEEAAQSILYKAESLRPAQISGYALDQYIGQVRDALDGLRRLKTENMQKIAQEQKTLDSLLCLEKELREKARIP